MWSSERYVKQLQRGLEECSLPYSLFWQFNFVILGADCSSDAERYFELLKESKVRGYLFEQQNYIPKE